MSSTHPLRDIEWAPPVPLHTIPLDSPTLRLGNILKLPFLIPQNSQHSLDPDVISLKSFRTSDGGKQLPGRAEYQPCIMLRIREDIAMDNEGRRCECYRVWLAGLFTFDDAEDPAAVAKRLETAHRSRRIADYLYIIHRSSGNPPMSPEMEALFNPMRPTLSITQTANHSHYEPPRRMWVYGEIQELLFPRLKLETQLPASLDHATHVCPDDLRVFFRDICRGNPLLDTAKMKEHIAYLPRVTPIVDLRGLRNNSGACGSGIVASVEGAHGSADKGAMKKDSTLYFLDDDYWTDGTSSALSRRSAGGSDNFSTFSLPLDQYPP